MLDVAARMSARVHAATGAETGRASESTDPHTAVDIVYDGAYTRGGSIGSHADDELGYQLRDETWGLVAILSFGQTRYLRIRPRGEGGASKPVLYNVELRDNSVVAMVGHDFQRDYTHGVDKLPKSVAVGARHSLNVRYVTPRQRRLLAAFQAT